MNRDVFYISDFFFLFLSGQCDFLYMPDKNKKKKAMFTKIPYELKMIQPEAVWDAVLIRESQWAFPVEWSTKKAFRQFRS